MHLLLSLPPLLLCPTGQTTPTLPNKSHIQLVHEKSPVNTSLLQSLKNAPSQRLDHQHTAQHHPAVSPLQVYVRKTLIFWWICPVPTRQLLFVMRKSRGTTGKVPTAQFWSHVALAGKAPMGGIDLFFPSCHSLTSTCHTALFPVFREARVAGFSW